MTTKECSKTASWEPFNKKLQLCATPNMFASQPSLEKQDGALIFEGYQSFVLSGYKAEPISSNLIQKSRVLSSMLQPKYFKHRSVLDIGGNAGYYSFKALEAGAE